MRSRFRPTLEAHHRTNSVGRGASERSIAALWLGAGHPLAGVLREAETVFAQLVSVTAVRVARDWRRLLNPRTAEQLAGSVDEILKVADQRPPLHPAARPIFHIGVIRRVAPELHQVASLLRVGRPCVRGVAAVEWLLTSAGSPLYDVDVESLRQELGRVRYLLGVTS